MNLNLEIRQWARQLLGDAPLLGEKIVNRVEGENNDTVEDALREMLRFLYLCSKTQQSLTPSRTVDNIWHEFILFTRLYHKFCIQNFGKFIHHQPNDSQSSNIEQYHHTLVHYQRNFDRVNTRYWPQISAASAYCGFCEN